MRVVIAFNGVVMEMLEITELQHTSNYGVELASMQNTRTKVQRVFFQSPCPSLMQTCVGMCRIAEACFLRFSAN